MVRGPVSACAASFARLRAGDADAGVPGGKRTGAGQEKSGRQRGRW